MAGTEKRLWTFSILAFAMGILVGATSAVQIAPRIQTEDVALVAPDDPGGVSSNGAPSNVPTTGNLEIDDVVAGNGLPTVATGFECAAGRNGGATDVGVTEDRIILATTTVQSGEGADFLGEVKFGMEAVKNKVNREGGICGRMLAVKYVDDGWDAARGSTFLKNFIKEGVFAIPVGASSEGLNVVIKGGVIDRAGIPVVGTDGLIISQYTDSWVWPVATATVSSARIMARTAYERGARKFSIVFDKNYRFGVEAANAFNSEVARLLRKKPGEPGVDGFNRDNNCVRSFCGVLSAQPSYASEVNQFDPGDFVAMFLEPKTALTWMATPGAPKPSVVPIGAGQPLFTREFAESCQSACHGMWVWTGYRPPIESHANEAAVREFVRDLKRTKPDADEFNAFTMGGYTGMELLVEALKEVGPLLTRVRLREVLDSMKFRNGLTIQDDLSWRPGNHFANVTMQAFEIQNKGTFSGWRARVIERDPTPKRGEN